MVLEDCNVKVEDINKLEQTDKLKYATLLSLSLKIVSDINLTGSKIINNMLISSHSFMFESYCSINRLTTILEDWIEGIYSKLQIFAFGNRKVPYYPEFVKHHMKDIKEKFKIHIEDRKYASLLEKLIDIVFQYMEDRFNSLLKPKENGDFEIATSQIGKITINSLRLYGILVVSLDRIYQYYTKNYGKPVLILNSVLIANSKFKYVKEFIDLIKENIPECNQILIYADEQLLSKEDLLSCQINSLIEFLKEHFPNIKLENLHL